MIGLEFDTIHTIESRLTTTKSKRQRREPKKRRHVVWSSHNHEIIREGKAMNNTQDLVDLLDRGEACVDNFYIWRHTTSGWPRNNSNEPLYEATYYLKHEKRHVKAQKAHLMQAYRNSNRTNAERRWEVLENGEPYWVDRFAYRSAKK